MHAASELEPGVESDAFLARGFLMSRRSAALLVDEVRGFLFLQVFLAAMQAVLRDTLYPSS